MVEPTLNVDTFGKNVKYKNEQAILREIYHLIVMKPGTDILNPEKGCDLNKYCWSFKDDLDLSGLQQEIRNQINDYTRFTLTNIVCNTIKKNNNWILYCFISIYGIENPFVIASNGTDSQYKTFSQELMSIMTEGVS